MFDCNFFISGAPGTPPPRNLVRKLHATNGLNNNYSMRDEFVADMMMKNHQQLLSDFAGLSLDSAYNGLIPPPGAPTSPPSNGAGHAFFGNGGGGNMRMMAPPHTMAMQSPFYYYGGV